MIALMATLLFAISIAFFCNLLKQTAMAYTGYLHLYPWKGAHQCIQAEVFFALLVLSIYSAPNFDIETENLWCLTGTRETSFLYALYTAALLYAVSQACATNKLNSCHCTTGIVVPEFSPMVSMYFCPDNVEYGAKFIRSFLDIHYEEANQFYDTSRHNALIGIKVSQAQFQNDMLVNNKINKNLVQTRLFCVALITFKIY